MNEVKVYRLWNNETTSYVEVKKASAWFDRNAAILAQYRLGKEGVNTVLVEFKLTKLNEVEFIEGKNE